MGNLKLNDERAKGAIILIWIVMTLNIVSFISGYFQFDLLKRVANGEEISYAVAVANDLRERIISVLSFIAYIVSAVTFILWFRRAYFNLHQKLSYLSYKERWAAGSWFVPIVNLYRPFKIMRELYLETEALLMKKKVQMQTKLATDLLGWWWALWIANSIIGNFVFHYSIKLQTLTDAISANVAGMASNIVGIPLAIITVKIIKSYAGAEPLLNEIKEQSQDVCLSDELVFQEGLR